MSTTSKPLDCAEPLDYGWRFAYSAMVVMMVALAIVDAKRGQTGSLVPLLCVVFARAWRQPPPESHPISSHAKMSMAMIGMVLFFVSVIAMILVGAWWHGSDEGPHPLFSAIDRVAGFAWPAFLIAFGASLLVIEWWWLPRQRRVRDVAARAS
ncbi:MAG: hypothetical protein NTW19_02080 [Planctomycetota bacterium]|nr:hypothetical protein [Planctomycetota bacterium]